MENLFIIYEIIDNINQIKSINNIRNCINVKINKYKEVYLFDLLNYLTNNLSTNFLFYTITSLEDPLEWVLIDSPGSILPVYEVDSLLIVYILMKSTSCSNIIISNQWKLHYNKSLQVVYNNESNSYSNSYSNSTTTKPVNNQSNQSTNYPSNYPTNNFSNNTTNYSSNNQPKTNKSRSKESLLSSNKSNENISLQSYVNEESINAIAEAAKEAASNAAKSIFSFATSSIRNVTEAANNLSISSTSISLSKTKVNIVKELAQGGYGKIYLANDSNNASKQYALKQILCQTKEIEQDGNNEIQALEQLKHPNIIQLVDYIFKHNNNNMIKTLYLLFPLYSFGTIHDCIERVHPNDNEYDSVPWPFPQARLVNIARQVTSALLYIHEKGFTHRDLKPHNILLTEDYTPILTDFGSIGPGSIQVTTRQQALTIEEEAAMKTSAPYRPPELTSMTYPCIIDERVDIWSLGCTIYCTAFGNSPFESTKEGVKRLAILNGRFTIPPDRRMRDCVYSVELIDIIKRMLQVNPSNRPFTGKVLELLNSLSI